MISVELHVKSGKHVGQVIRLDRKKFLIGRESDCQLRPKSELVSRHHCIFTVDDFSVRLRDLGSTNGTLVNEERIRKEVVLNPGDTVVVGSLTFEVVVNDASDVSKTGAISAVSKETVVAGTETMSELKAIPTAEALGTEVPPAVNEPAAADPASPVPPPAELPAGGVGDTTVIAQPAIMPGQMPYQPMMPQQMGYPPMYGQYPYPGQMPMYPQQGYMQPMPGYPQQPQMPTAPEPPAKPSAGGQANVALPDPSQTGAKVDPPKPPPNPEEKGTESPQSNKSAADIIKQHMQRRPGG